MTYFVMQLGASVFLKATVVLALAALVATLLRRSSAATRHLIWSLALAALVVLPVLDTALPAWSWDVPSVAEGGRVEPAAVNPAPTGDVAPANVTSVMAVSLADQPSLPATIAVTIVVIGLWGGGVLLLLGRLAVHLQHAHGIARRGAPAVSAVQRRASGLAKRAVRVVVSREISVPASMGVFRPWVLLPEASRRWPADQVDIVLRHEVAHITRCDYVFHLIVETCKALYWPNPLVWFAARRSEIERERACDDRALASGVPSQSYATRLVEMARAQFEAAGALAMAQRSGLAERVRSILSGSTDRSPVGAARFAVIGAMAALVTLPVATYQVVRDRLPTIEEILTDLESDDVATARRAAWWLGEREDPSTVEALMRQLRAGHPDVRLVAAWALGEIKDPSAIGALAGALDADDPYLREMATLSLGETEHPDALRPIMDAFDAREELRPAAFWALGEIKTEEARAAQHTAANILERAPTEHAQVWTGRIERGEAAVDQSVPDLVRQLERSQDASERRRAAWSLGVLGELDAVDPLLDALRDPDPSVRAMAVWALDEINPSRAQ
jgi:beta-lactamase regulating signal transducer with metallopeptidase domain